MVKFEETGVENEVGDYFGSQSMSETSVFIYRGDNSGCDGILKTLELYKNSWKDVN